jgi:thioesterase domain-containing protein
LQYHTRKLWRLSARARLPYLRDLASRRQRQQHTQFKSDATLPEAVQAVERANRVALHAYLPGRYGGRLTLVRSTERFDGFDVNRRGWRDFAEQLDIHEVAGSSHLDILSNPHGAQVAEILRQSIRNSRPSGSASP